MGTYHMGNRVGICENVKLIYNVVAEFTDLKIQSNIFVLQSVLIYFFKIATLLSKVFVCCIIFVS